VVEDGLAYLSLHGKLSGACFKFQLYGCGVKESTADSISISAQQEQVGYITLRGTLGLKDRGEAASFIGLGNVFSLSLCLAPLW
jgi:hypothetical protein